MRVELKAQSLAAVLMTADESKKIIIKTEAFQSFFWGTQELLFFVWNVPGKDLSGTQTKYSMS